MSAEKAEAGRGLLRMSHQPIRKTRRLKRMHRGERPGHYGRKSILQEAMRKLLLRQWHLFVVTQSRTTSGRTSILGCRVKARVTVCRAVCM